MTEVTGKGLLQVTEVTGKGLLQVTEVTGKGLLQVTEVTGTSVILGFINSLPSTFSRCKFRGILCFHESQI